MTEFNLYYLFINYCIKTIPRYILLISLEKAEICILSQYDNIYFLIMFFKKHTNTLLNVLSDITAVDYPQKKNLGSKSFIIFLVLNIIISYVLKFQLRKLWL